jgi:hypothetical protein
MHFVEQIMYFYIIKAGFSPKFPLNFDQFPTILDNFAPFVHQNAPFYTIFAPKCTKMHHFCSKMLHFQSILHQNAPFLHHFSPQKPYFLSILHPPPCPPNPSACTRCATRAQSPGHRARTVAACRRMHATSAADWGHKEWEIDQS